MSSSHALIRSVAAAAVLTAAAAAAAAQAQGEYINATVGGPLRPGVYGRVLVNRGPPPPLISNRPVVAVKALGPVRGEPMYLYLPPGHIRKWVKYCRDYQACERPVYFVRMDNNPGKFGSWKARVKPQERPGARPLAGAGERF